MNLTDFVEAKEIILEKLKFASVNTLGGTAIESLKIGVDYNHEIESMLIGLTGYLLADKIADDQYTFYFDSEHYFSWWQMFKQDKMPNWFKSRYPVRYFTQHHEKMVKFERYATYPKANVAIPKNSDFFVKQLGGVEFIHDRVTDVS